MKSDADIGWKPEVERRFLALHRTNHKKEILLIGADESAEYFENHADDDAESMLLIVSLRREQTVDQASTTAMKAKLMKEAWHPELFRK